MPNHLTNLEVEYVSLVDRAAVRDPSNPTEPQRFLLWKRESGAPESSKGGDMSEELSAALEKAQAERDEAVAERDEVASKLEKAEEQLKKAETQEGPEPEEINKDDLPEAVRDMLAKAEADRDEQKKAAEKALKIAKAERELRVAKEFVELAKGEFPNISGDPVELGGILKTAKEKLDKEEYDALTQRLRAVNAQVETASLFSELGKSGEPMGQEMDMDIIAKKAEEIKKSDPSLTDYEAQVLAMRTDVEAQARYVQSFR